MEKIRVSVYWEMGKDKGGNQLISYIRDDLAEIKLGILDKEEDIAVEIIEISKDEITLKADGKKYPLKKGERVEFDCWTGYYGDSSDKTADILLAVNSIIHSKTFDNGMICASEQSVIVLESIYDAVKAEFAARGCYFLNPLETEKVRKTIIINGALNAKIVGQRAAKIAELAGVTVPAGTKILIGEVESVELSEEFAHEKLSPVLAMYKAKTFAEALDKADKLVEDGGFGQIGRAHV